MAILVCATCGNEFKIATNGQKLSAGWVGLLVARELVAPCAGGFGDWPGSLRIRIQRVGGPVGVRARGLAPGLIGEAALLGGVSRTVGLGPRGWLVGAAGGLAVNAAVARGLHRSGVTRPGPADLVTLTRAILTCAVAGLVSDAADTRAGAAPGRGTDVRALFPLSAGALALDAVDGWVARRTGTSTPFGARFDGEVDALLILTLSLRVARSHGSWVLGAGLARYAFAAAGWVLPWMRRPLPPRYWRKVAAATEGIALAAALLPGLPRSLRTAGLAAGSALIAESFGRDVWWLWRRRREPLSRSSRWRANGADNRHPRSPSDGVETRDTGPPAEGAGTGDPGHR